MCTSACFWVFVPNVWKFSQLHKPKSYVINCFPRKSTQKIFYPIFFLHFKTFTKITKNFQHNQSKIKFWVENFLTHCSSIYQRKSQNCQILLTFTRGVCEDFHLQHIANWSVKTLNERWMIEFNWFTKNLQSYPEINLHFFLK